MSEPFQELVHFFVDNCPDVMTLALGGPPGLAWAAACLLGAGLLKSRLKLKTGYTRKVFHFLIFGTVVIVQEILAEIVVGLLLMLGKMALYTLILLVVVVVTVLGVRYMRNR